MTEGSASSMDAVVTALQGIVTTDAMFTNLSKLLPVVGGVLIFSFTYRIVRRIGKGASKGKVNY